MGAGFVARGFVGEREQLTELIKAAIDFRGYALVDILQPCVSFNKINTYQWYQERAYKLDSSYDRTDYSEALKKAEEWGENIPIGIIYQKEKPIFRDRFSQLDDTPMVKKGTTLENTEKLLRDFM